MSVNLEARVEVLELRVVRLERRERTIVRFLDANRARFVFFMLDNDITPEQSNGITDVLESVYQRIIAGENVGETEFERLLLPHIPSEQKRGGYAYDFIKGLLMNLEGRWPQLFQHFKGKFNVTHCG